MLTLESTITFNEATIKSSNLCDRFSGEDLDRIGAWVHENYMQDKQSRKDWEIRTENAINLAMQLQKEKTFPWAGCSNIAFPLVTIAALQFHARAYPAIVNGRSVVQCRVVGGDPQGVARARADRISAHMSWQLLEQDEAWEEGQDRALINIAVVGVGFKKSYFDPGVGHNISEFVAANDLVVNYWARSIESAQVKTHVFPLYKNEIHERVLRGSYRDCLETEWFTGGGTVSDSLNRQDQDQRSGTAPAHASGSDVPFTIFEQHCWLDLDDDGYAEPYIVTIEESSQYVLRIVARVDRVEDVERDNRNRIIRINATEYFTKMPFIPSPDGGIYDIGFGTLLGPLNESVNTSINQLFDAGTVSNTAGGFLGRGAKIRGGVYEFKPFGWHRVDATGDDLRKSIFPLPVREPSAVMFNLLSLLIDYTNRVSGSTDMMVGENPGQNTPAETTRSMLEQGQKIYSAIFKRVWRSMKQEFRKLYILNAKNLQDRTYFGEDGVITREEYAAAGISVVPVADPTISSDGARFTRAQMVADRAAANPGYDPDAVERELLRTLGIDEIETLYPGQANRPSGPSEKIQVEQIRAELKMAQLEQEKMRFVMTLQEDVRVNNAKIQELMAKASLLAEQAEGEPGRRNVEAFRAGIEAMREQNKQRESQLDRMMEMFNGEQRRTGTVSGMEGGSGNSALSPAFGTTP